jgi:hypothetical protein
MIGYFVKAGDFRADKAFHPYKSNFNKLLKERIGNKIYGESLKLVLIEYHLEGEFLSVPEEIYHLKSYRKKERSVAVVVYVRKEFNGLSDLEKKNFIINTTLDTIFLVKDSMAHKGITDINFPMLIKDIQECAKEYVNLQISSM